MVERGIKGRRRGCRQEAHLQPRGQHSPSHFHLRPKIACCFFKPHLHTSLARQSTETCRLSATRLKCPLRAWSGDTPSSYDIPTAASLAHAFNHGASSATANCTVASTSYVFSVAEPVTRRLEAEQSTRLEW
jgi:hypothetical protein